MKISKKHQIICTAACETRNAFIRYHTANNDFYKEYEKACLSRYHDGMHSVNSMNIMDHVRVNVSKNFEHGGYKPTHDYAAYYGRLFNEYFEGEYPFCAVRPLTSARIIYNKHYFDKLYNGKPLVWEMDLTTTLRELLYEMRPWLVTKPKVKEVIYSEHNSTTFLNSSIIARRERRKQREV